MQTISAHAAEGLRVSVIQVADIAERSTNPPRFTSDSQRVQASSNHRTENQSVCSHSKMSNGQILQAQHKNEENEGGSRKAAD